MGHRVVAQPREGLRDSDEGEPLLPGVAVTYRTADAILFNAWFAAYLTHDPNGMRVAAKRFRPEFRPRSSPGSPPTRSPTPNATGRATDDAAVHPERPGAGTRALDQRARHHAYYADGQKAAETSDEYIRVTVILASVLFLVGLSTQFPLLGVRYIMISVGAGLLIFAGVLILTLPGPP